MSNNVLLLKNTDSTMQLRETKVGEDHQFDGSAPRIGPLRRWGTEYHYSGLIWRLRSFGGQAALAICIPLFGRIDLHGNPIHFLEDSLRSEF